MWTNINQVYTSYNSQNCWAHLVGTGAWHKVLTGATDGVTNVFLILSSAKANGKQVYVVLDGSKNITQVYM